MGNEEFIKECIHQVVFYHNDHVDTLKGENNFIENKDVFVVWQCKALQNNKALLSTNQKDGMYYELTYNGDKKELYLDAYKKSENKCIIIEEVN
ncbi:MAG: DUF6275 family protein [Clostridia bacterium]